MAQVGIKTAYIRVGDQVLELDHSFLGVNKADIKGIEPNVGEIDGSNEVQAYYFEGTGKSSIALTVNQLGMEWISKITGMQKAGSGSLFVLGDRPADVGVVVVSPEFGTNKEAVFAMDKAAATYSSASLSTNTSSKTNVVADVVTFNGISSDKLGGKTIGIGEYDDGSAVLQELGWSTATKGSGNYKDDSSSSAPVKPQGSH